MLSRSSYNSFLSVLFLFPLLCFSLCALLLIASFNDPWSAACELLCCDSRLLHTSSLPCFSPACFFQCVSSFSLGSFLFLPGLPVCVERGGWMSNRSHLRLRPPVAFTPSGRPSGLLYARKAVACSCAFAAKPFFISTARSSFHGLVRTKRRRRRKKNLRRL